MLSKATIKWINTLERKKNRDEEGIFVAEGVKIVQDLLPVLKCKFLAVSDKNFLDKKPKIIGEIEEISPEEYKKITFQKSPQGVLAVFEKPKYDIDYSEIEANLNIALDEIQDPGNLGTIIRLADWFGINDVFCSMNSADVFSPKTIQATMGSIARVRAHYVDLSNFLQKMKDETTIYGTFMDGNNIYQENLSKNGIIVLGNEGNGISNAILPAITKKLGIPNFSKNETKSESLNVGVAAAIVISEFKRKK